MECACENNRKKQHNLAGSNQDPNCQYRNLANAIICAAAEDYRLALKNGDHRMRESVERFFRSDWYSVLSDLDAEIIITRLQQEHDPCCRIKQ